MIALLAGTLVVAVVLGAGAGWAGRPGRSHTGGSGGAGRTGGAGRSGGHRSTRRRPRRYPSGHPGIVAAPERSGVDAAIVGAAVFGVAVVAGPLVCTAVIGVGLAGRWAGVRRRRAVRDRRIDEAIPDLIDLLGVAAAVGRTVPGLLIVVADRSPPAVRVAMQRAVRRLDRGASVSEVLDGLAPDLGSLGAALAEALRTAHRTGAPLAPALDRLGDVARDRRRRSAEARARRLPVTLLLPLVCCILPAFGLLAVVPLIAAALGDLA